MAIVPDPLTLKRDYLERKIHEYARAAGVPIDSLRWDRAAKPEISELIIRSGGQEKRYSLPDTDAPPLPGLGQLTNSDLDLLADNIVKGWQ
jgi:hypothetical protein